MGAPIGLVQPRQCVAWRCQLTEGAINPAATLRCHPRAISQCPREENRGTDGEYQLGAHARVALVLLTLSASIGLAGCAAVDDLKVSIFDWFDTVNFTGEGEELLGYAPEARLIPPAEIPRPAAKTPRKKIKAATRKLPQPQTVVLPPKKPPIAEFPETAMPGETEGQSARPPSMRPGTRYPETPPPFEERFCSKCWRLPAKAE
jgi:hypothetical protein